MKYRIKTFKPEYFSDLRHQPQYKYRWWPFWFNGPSFRLEYDAALWIAKHKDNDLPRYNYY